MFPAMIPPFSSEPSTSSLPRQVGDMVYFWTGRGSHGYATIRAFKGEKILLDPEPDATRGSDFRLRRTHPNGPYWIPRNYGVPLSQIDTAPNFWWTNF